MPSCIFLQGRINAALAAFTTTLSYIEGWHVIAGGDRFFGFDGWDRETLKSECVLQGRHKNRYSCTYTSKVGIKVRAGGVTVIREGSGCGTANAGVPGRMVSPLKKPRRMLSSGH